MTRVPQLDYATPPPPGRLRVSRLAMLSVALGLATRFAAVGVMMVTVRLTQPGQVPIGVGIAAFVAVNAVGSWRGWGPGWRRACRWPGGAAGGPGCGWRCRGWC